MCTKVIVRTSDIYTTFGGVGKEGRGGGGEGAK